MASDTLPETQSRPQPLRKQHRGGVRGSSRRRWWWLGLFAVAAMAVAVSAAALLPPRRSSLDLGPRLTHRISRGELVVTVTEQGTLESSNNTEIKCKVRGKANTVTWVIESGSKVKEGDELLRLETLLLEEEISERTKFAHLSKSTAVRSGADVERAKLAISEYLEGRYVTELAKLEKDLAIAESRLRTTRNMRDHAKMMFDSEYVSELAVEENEFALAQADLAVKLVETRIDVLKRFTKQEQLARLSGDLAAAEAQHEADKEQTDADEQRLERAQEELNYCIVKAERDGMVIYPSAQAWKEVPDIEEGATVHKDQVLLLMPDLSNMQVKVGIHESIVDRVRAGLAAKVTLPDRTLDGTVCSVSPVTRPAGWWTGNVVKYDTVIELPAVEGLKPGMTAEVEVAMDRHENVLMIPTAAVVETKNGYACWVETATGTQRHALQLGDSSDMFIVVEAGLEEGDEVVLDPLASIEEAQTEAAMMLEETGDDGA